MKLASISSSNSTNFCSAKIKIKEEYPGIKYRQGRDLRISAYENPDGKGCMFYILGTDRNGRQVGAAIPFDDKDDMTITAAINDAANTLYKAPMGNFANETLSDRAFDRYV